jgi:GDSL-like Lipase/Acylhydrolase family
MSQKKPASLSAIAKQAKQEGEAQAVAAVAMRAKALARRRKALNELAKSKAKGQGASFAAAPAALTSAGLLMAEGDSWFDYPFVDILKVLDDDYGYDVEDVAHKGDRIEDMAYDGGQVDDFTRKLEKLATRGKVPKAILLSGGGNDVAGREFGMLLDHAGSATAGLNENVLVGVIDKRIYAAYMTVIGRVTALCQQYFAKKLPILVHTYDYPVPDGRGILFNLFGPWLQPGFNSKGFYDLARLKALAKALIDRFGNTVKAVASDPGNPHVRFVELRDTLTTGPNYKVWWDNELHPTRKGFEKVTAKFAAVLATLP